MKYSFQFVLKDNKTTVSISQVQNPLEERFFIFSIIPNLIKKHWSSPFA